MNLFSNWLGHKLPFFYGYLMVALAVLTQICSSPGQTFAISALTPHLKESLNLSSSQLAAAYMLGTLLAALPLALIGPLADRFGIRWTTAAVGLGLSGACILTSQATGFTSILIGFLFLRFLGQGALTLLGSNLVSMWFQKRLGTVNAFMSVGGALAFAAVPPLLVISIEEFGWRAAYVTIGILISVLLVPTSILLLRNRPEDLAQRQDGELLSHAVDASLNSTVAVKEEADLNLRQAASHRTFWILTADLTCWAMIGTGLVFHAFSIFQEQGIASSQIPYLFTTFSSAMLFAQIAGGILADRTPMHRLLAFGFLMLAVGAGIVPLTSNLLHMHLFAATFGLGQGFAIAANSTMWVRYYGREHLGKIRGTVWCITVAGSGCGPLILGIVHDTFDSFTPGLWAFVMVLAPLVPLSLWATKPPRKCAQAASLKPQTLDHFSDREAHHQNSLSPITESAGDEAI